MISLSLSNGKATKRVEALQRIVSVLLQGISLHSFQFDPAESLTFQQGIRKLRAELERADDDDTAILLTGAAIRLLEEHNDAAQTELQARKTELCRTVETLGSTLLQLCQGGPELTQSVTDMYRQMESASDAAGIAAARARLTQLASRLASDAADVRAGRRVVGPEGETDAITGLPDSGFAGAAMKAIWDRREHYYAVMFAVERLESINVRFGFKAGDQVLLILSQHVAQHMGTRDQLFRWRGPCLLALIERDMPESLVASEVSRTIHHRMEHAITMGDREVMVPIAASWNLFPLCAAESVERTVADLNAYALNRTVKASTAAAR